MPGSTSIFLQQGKVLLPGTDLGTTVKKTEKIHVLVKGVKKKVSKQTLKQNDFIL